MDDSSTALCIYAFSLLFLSGAAFGYWLNDVIALEKDCKKYEKETHDE